MVIIQIVLQSKILERGLNTNNLVVKLNKNIVVNNKMMILEILYIVLLQEIIADLMEDNMLIIIVRVDIIIMAMIFLVILKFLGFKILFSFYQLIRKI